MPGGRITQHRKRSPYQSFFLIQRPLFLYFPYSVFSLLSRIFTGFLSLPICDLCFRFRLIFQRSFLFHFPVVDFLFFGKIMHRYCTFLDFQNRFDKVCRIVFRFVHRPLADSFRRNLLQNGNASAFPDFSVSFKTWNPAHIRICHMTLQFVPVWT